MHPVEQQPTIPNLTNSYMSIVLKFSFLFLIQNSFSSLLIRRAPSGKPTASRWQAGRKQANKHTYQKESAARGTQTQDHHAPQQLNPVSSLLPHQPYHYYAKGSLAWTSILDCTKTTKLRIERNVHAPEQLREDSSFESPHDIGLTWRLQCRLPLCYFPHHP